MEIKAYIVLKKNDYLSKYVSNSLVFQLIHMMKAQKIMRILRESNDYSQEYVANILDINQKTYSNLESGKTKLTIDRINQLAEMYKVKPEYFLSDELPVVNYNSGPNSHGGVFENYHNSSNEVDILKTMYEKLLEEKNERILQLDKQVQELTKLVEKLTNKIR